jgi:hypothetical protein
MADSQEGAMPGMPAKNRARDLVLTYSVSSDGRVGGEHAQLHEALKGGHRVVDVLTTPCGGGLFVTVVLTERSDLDTPYRSFFSK